MSTPRTTDPPDINPQAIRDYRRTHCLSQAAFARLAGLSRNTVSNIECGRHRTSFVTAQRLAALFAADDHQAA